MTGAGAVCEDADFVAPGERLARGEYHLKGHHQV